MGDAKDNDKIQCIYLAKLAEQAERYDEMVEYMKQVVDQNGNEDLTLEERNLLSVAYKNVVGARRASLRIINSIAAKEEEKNSGKKPLVDNYMRKVEEELNNICTDILELLIDKRSSNMSLIERAENA